MNLLMAVLLSHNLPSNPEKKKKAFYLLDEENQEFYCSIFFLENGLLIKFCIGQQLIPEMVPLQCGWADVSEVLLSG